MIGVSYDNETISIIFLQLIISSIPLGTSINHKNMLLCDYDQCGTCHYDECVTFLSGLKSWDRYFHSLERLVLYLEHHFTLIFCQKLCVFSFSKKVGRFTDYKQFICFESRNDLLRQKKAMKKNSNSRLDAWERQSSTLDFYLKHNQTLYHGLSKPKTNYKKVLWLKSWVNFFRKP